MELTNRNVKAVSLSGIALIFLSLAISIAVVLSFLPAIKWQNWDNVFDALTLAILGIGLYYLLFGVLSAIIRKKKIFPEES